MSATTRDFPDWFGPMLVKELRQGLKTRGFVLSFVALQGLLVLAVVINTLTYARDPARFTPAGFTWFFWLLIGMQLLIITPLRAMNALVGERKANTLELIFMTGLTSWRIAVGKWVSLLFQAALFVLAVLPYAILRYFFGGVNLAEELLVLGFILVLSAMSTAVALAISGMPLFVRGAATCVAVFFVMSFLPGLFFGLAMGRTGMVMMGLGLGVSWKPVMGLLFFDAALLCLAALEVAGASISPVAENHALRQRLIALAAWLPVPLLIAVDVSTALGQLGFFTALAFISCWHDFARQPRLMHNQVEPFARRGPPARFLGWILYPGWPGALLFFLLVQVVVLASCLLIWKQASSPGGILAAAKAGDAAHAIRMLAMLCMGGAALLTAPLLLGNRTRARLPLLEHTLLYVAGGIVALFAAQWLAIYGKDLGDHLWLALFPPAGFWAITTASDELVSLWLLIAVSVLTVLIVVLLGRAVPHWRRLLALEREIRAGAPAPARAAAAVDT